MPVKLTLLLLLFTAPVFAQCEQTIKTFPAVRYLKLGMTEKEVKTFLGTRYSEYTADEWRRVTKSAEIERIHIDFLADRVMHFSIYYSRSLKWNNALEFAEVVSQHLPLPQSAWKRTSRDLVSMECRDFYVNISTLYNRLDFTTDLTANDNERPDYKRQSTFKP